MAITGNDDRAAYGVVYPGAVATLLPTPGKLNEVVP